MGDFVRANNREISEPIDVRSKSLAGSGIQEVGNWQIHQARPGLAETRVGLLSHRQSFIGRLAKILGIDLDSNPGFGHGLLHQTQGTHVAEGIGLAKAFIIHPVSGADSSAATSSCKII